MREPECSCFQHILRITRFSLPYFMKEIIKTDCRFVLIELI
ncbi:hypothetical protein WZ342_2509 [Enterococcus faecalis]|nr:hypothetical protein WZ342_2509 [Enterococcus faecalis]